MDNPIVLVFSEGKSIKTSDIISSEYETNLIENFQFELNEKPKF